MSAFAARYARALADVVLDAKLNVSEVQQQLQDFSRTLDGSEDLRRILFNPSIPAQKRVSVLDAVNARVGCGKKVRNFLAVLIVHERLSALHELLEEYRLEMNRRLGISDATVVTARKLEDGERQDLERQAAALAGTKVHATFQEDASLIGGAIVRVGSVIYDGSVRGRLEKMKDQLAAS